jgi:SAM-dependent methyltransferase
METTATTSAKSAAFKETDIRPDHLMKGQAERFAADLARLIERKSEFVEVSCPACGTDEAETAFHKYELRYVVCSSCETMYINPRPTPEILEMYYSTSENYAYWNNYIFPASEETRREKIFRPRAERVVEFCERYEIARGALLEVGAGFGTFCEEMGRLNFFKRLLAVEPTPDLAETCRKRGLEVIEKPVEQLQLKEGEVDVVVSFEAIEHMFSPENFVRQCARMLSEGGLLILTCPSVKGFDVVVLQSISDTVDPEHLNYFHPASLSQLVESCGFEVLEVQTPGKLDAELVRKKALAGQFDLSAQPFLNQLLIDEWERVGAAFQQFLADNMLSSHMWLVAKKRKGN